MYRPTKEYPGFQRSKAAQKRKTAGGPWLPTLLIIKPGEKKDNSKAVFAK